MDGGFGGEGVCVEVVVRRVGRRWKLVRMRFVRVRVCVTGATRLEGECCAVQGLDEDGGNVTRGDSAGDQCEDNEWRSSA